jgi:hypothetical protein
MTNKVTLPSGETVTLKDPTSLRVKDRKKVLRSAEADGGDLSKALALGDALIAMLVEEWSFDLIIPSVKIETLDELTMADYDALVEFTKDAQKFLFPTISNSDENEADPKVPTANSNG